MKWNEWMKSAVKTIETNMIGQTPMKFNHFDSDECAPFHWKSNKKNVVYQMTAREREMKKLAEKKKVNK